MGEKKTKEIYCNIPEEITREARWLVFYDKSKLTFNQNLKAEVPPIDDYLFKVRVNNINRFKRNVRRKMKESNRYSEVKISELFYPIKNKDIIQLSKWEEKNAYVVLLVTNNDIQVFGNHLEPMSFRIDDNVKDNGSGDDSYSIIVEGNTTVLPRSAMLPEETKAKYFKVLLFTNPIR